MTKRDLRLLGASVIAVAFMATVQSAAAQDEGPAAPAPVSAPAPAVAAPAASATIPEGTAVQIRFEEKLSSATATAGDRFSVSLNEEIRLPDGTVIPAGYRGAGEVTVAEKKGFMGKAGQLNVRLDSLRIGNARVPLRASKGQEGKGAVGATIALTVIFGPVGLLKKGHDIEIQTGQTIEAFVDRDAEISIPVAAPPTT